MMQPYRFAGKRGLSVHSADTIQDITESLQVHLSTVASRPLCESKLARNFELQRVSILSKDFNKYDSTRGIFFSVLLYHLMGLSYHFFVNSCYINVYNISLYFCLCASPEFLLSACILYLLFLLQFFDFS